MGNDILKIELYQSKDPTVGYRCVTVELQNAELNDINNDKLLVWTGMAALCAVVDAHPDVNPSEILHVIAYFMSKGRAFCVERDVIDTALPWIKNKAAYKPISVGWLM